VHHTEGWLVAMRRACSQSWLEVLMVMAPATPCSAARDISALMSVKSLNVRWQCESITPEAYPRPGGRAPVSVGRPRPVPSCMKHAHAILAALFALLASSTLAEPTTEETWYVVELAGAKSGWMLERIITDEGTITTESEMTISMKRAGTAISIRLKTGFTETVDGEPVSMKQMLDFGGTPSVSSFVWKGDEVEQTQGIGDQAFTTTVPSPGGDWLTPAEGRRYFVERLKDNPEEITFAVLEAGTGLTPVTTTMSDFERTTIDIFGASVPGITCSAVASTAPNIVTHNAITEEGDLLRTSVSLGALEFIISKASRELALSDLQAPEVMSATFVTPDKPIRSPRTLRKATFLLSVKDGRMPDLPSAGAQRSERVDGRTVRVIVNPGSPLPAPGVNRDDFLGRSEMLDTEDEAIQALTEDAEGKETLARAEFLRDVVFGHITNKNLGVGFASASDVARSKSGDCSEHAALLAAMLRVEGIPSRVVSGLIYADSFAGSRDIFGYHMWAQALIEQDGEPHWIDLDGTLPPWMSFDATHIAIAATPLDDGMMADNAMIELAPLLGNLQIKVEEAE